MTNTTFSTRVKAPTTSMSAVGASSGDTRAYDDMFPNTTGRNISDCNNKAGKQLINCKFETKISFQNVRTLQMKEKRIELANLFNSNNLTILGIADHKIVHQDDIENDQIQNSTLITTSAW